MTATALMPLLERLRKGANCVGFLDGAPEPAADVADMLRKAADEIERLQLQLGDELPATNSLLFDSIAENERLRVALLVAREEICWWVSEHGCCAGREDHALTVVDAALANQQSMEKKS